MNDRRLDMEDAPHPLISLHPAAVMGSLVAGMPNGAVARYEAEPLPEPEKHPLRERLAALFRRLSLAAA